MIKVKKSESITLKGKAITIIDNKFVDEVLFIPKMP
jgi:hypothetical protein